MENLKYYWVVGSCKKGFKIVTKRPRHTNVREPFTSIEACQRYIAFEWLMYSYTD